ncbi:MAG: hypothetical protein IPH32_16345 [Bacteroidetes bacterium]|nr:hypothetical protein [Bacteroidota bacterium]
MISRKSNTRKIGIFDILYEYEMVELNDAVVAMFEDFMEIGEVTPGFINDYINELKRHITFIKNSVKCDFYVVLKIFKTY